MQLDLDSIADVKTLDRAIQLTFTGGADTRTQVPFSMLR